MKQLETIFLFTTVEVVVIKDEKIFDVYIVTLRIFVEIFLVLLLYQLFMNLLFIRWDHPPNFINIEELDVLSSIINRPSGKN